MRDTQSFPAEDLNDLWLAMATAVVGIGAALVERGPLTVVLITVLCALCAAALRAAWRRRGAAADVRRLVAEHRMLRESIENNPMPYAVYDDQDCLIAWNKAYEATHAEAFRRLRSQAEQGRLLYGELLRVTASAGNEASAVTRMSSP